ncbi:hypothetical protein KY289_036390 [Solanum tuberosum]|nr:hypothetical protein KY289_036390 [Solanum tuberosum]
MASENFVQPAIPSFDGHYDHWSMLMENFHRSKEFRPVVNTGVQEPAAGTALLEVTKSRVGQYTSKQIWDSIKKKYQGTATAKRALLQTLHADFETFQTLRSSLLIHEQKMNRPSSEEQALQVSSNYHSSKGGGCGRGRVRGNILFPLNLNNIQQSCFLTKQGDEDWLWHIRFGHLNFVGLRTLQQKNMVHVEQRRHLKLSIMIFLD